MQSPDRIYDATAAPAEGNAISRSPWHSWESPVGLGIALVSLGFALVSTGAALVLVRQALLGG
jgi:hypothetical protein